MVVAFAVDVVVEEEIDCGRQALVIDFAEYAVMTVDCIYVERVAAEVVVGPMFAVAVAEHSLASMHSSA